MFVVALVVRIVVAWLAIGPGAEPYGDEATYHAVAANLARGAGFTLGSGAASHPTAFVPPLVPGLVSVLYRLTGADYFAGVELQCVLGALAPLLLAALAAALMGPGPGCIAGWLAALHPLLGFSSGHLLTETAFTVALLLALLASVAWIKEPLPGRTLGVGLLWGMAALTRPTALALPLVVAVWAWVPLGLQIGGRARVQRLAMLLAGVALVVAPWTMRNGVALHAWVPVTTGGGRALLDGNNPVNWADPMKRGGGASVFGLEPYATRFAGRSEPEIDRLAATEALVFLRAHVAEWPAMAVAKLARFWRMGAEGGRSGAWRREGSPLAALLARADPLRAWSVLVLPLALWGLVITARSPRRWFLSLPALVVLYFSALAVVFWGALRMRIPAEPLVLLFAGAGIEDVWRRMRPRPPGLRVVEGSGRSTCGAGCRPGTRDRRRTRARSTAVRSRPRAAAPGGSAGRRPRDRTCSRSGTGSRRNAGGPGPASTAVCRTGRATSWNRAPLGRSRRAGR
jgi:hypothetical protein